MKKLVIVEVTLAQVEVFARELYQEEWGKDKSYVLWRDLAEVGRKFYREQAMDCLNTCEEFLDAIQS